MNMENENKMVAFSKAIARARREMSLEETKLMMLYLSRLRWDQEGNPFEITIPKREVADLLNVNYDSSDLSEYLRELSRKMRNHSTIHFYDEIDKGWDDFNLFRRTKFARGNLTMIIDEYARPLLEGLKQDFITLWLADVMGMTADKTCLFYEYLRLHSDSRVTNTRLLTVEELRSILQISPDAYMEKVNGKPHFKRQLFEKYALNPVCEDLARCEHLKLLPYEDGKLWRKVKKYSLVQGYEFQYIVNMHPKVVKPVELEEIREDPEALKVAKDILKGKKKQKSQKNSFHNADERNYNYDDLMEQIRENQRGEQNNG